MTKLPGHLQKNRRCEKLLKPFHTSTQEIVLGPGTSHLT